MKLRPVLFEFDIPNLRSDRQTKTVRTIAKIIREGILDREPIKKYINETLSFQSFDLKSNENLNYTKNYYENAKSDP